MNEAYLRPGRTLGSFSRLNPDAWKQVDEFRANRKGLGDWPEGRQLLLALAEGNEPRSGSRTIGAW